MSDEAAGQGGNNVPKVADEPAFGSNVSAEDVEGTLRVAIRECAGQVIAICDDAPCDFASNVEATVSSANVATAWANIGGGLGRLLGEFRYSHGSGEARPPEADPAELDHAKSLIAEIAKECEHGASPTRIAQLISSEGF